MTSSLVSVEWMDHTGAADTVYIYRTSPLVFANLYLISRTHLTPYL